MNKDLLKFKFKRKLYKLIPVKTWRKKMLATLPPKYTVLSYTPQQITAFHELLKKYPHILSPETTLDIILQRKISFSRIGDGEFDLIIGEKNIFNKDDEKLKKRLIEINKEKNTPSCLVCLNYYSEDNKWFLYHGTHLLPRVMDTLSFGLEEYGDAYFLLSLIKNKDYTKTRSNNLWKNKNVLFVCRQNSLVREDILNIFSEVNNKDYLDVPALNAFDIYDSILEKITTYPKDWIIYLECGATASVLAWDLAKLNYQALDMGDFYKRLLNQQTSI